MNDTSEYVSNEEQYFEVSADASCKFFSFLFCLVSIVDYEDYSIGKKLF